MKYYRDLKLEIGELEEEKQEVKDKIRYLYDCKDEAQEKFLAMHEHMRNAASWLEKLRQDIAPYRAQEDLKLLTDIYPKMAENLRMVRFCKEIGLTTDNIRTLMTTGAATVSGKLRLPEYNRDFEARDAKIQLFKLPGDSYKLTLKINGTPIYGR